MPTEAVLLSAYALVLLGVAHGLRWLGKRSTSPYASRTLAGHLRVTEEVPEVHMDDWPHNEVPLLYAGMALTAALAATAVSTAGLVLHHETAAAVVLVMMIALSAATVVHLAGALKGLRNGDSS